MDLLWKKESNNADACYVDLLRIAKSNIYVKITDEEFTDFLREHSSPANQKNDTSAKMLKTDGNEQYKKGAFTKAMIAYNNCLCYSKHNSEIMSIAYANRSACFFKLKAYEKCLVDIELAIQGNLPEKLKEKLQERKINCLAAMAELVDNSHEFSTPKLSFEADPTYPEMANILEIKYDNTYGRHIVAKDKIDTGKIVLMEKQFSCGASLLTKIEQCITCFALNQNCIPCDGCVSAMFCNVDCKDKNKIHHMECTDPLPELGGHSRHVYNLVLNAITLFPNANDMMEFVKEALASKPEEFFQPTPDQMSKYRSFLALNITCLMDTELKFIPILYKAFTKLSSLSKIKEMFVTEQQKRFLLHLTAHHYLVLMSNMVDFSRVDKKSLFIIQSYFNYSCAPNILYYPYKDQSVCLTIRPIQKGEQLFVTYFGDFEEDRKVCHNQLLDFFGFDCSCQRCFPIVEESDLMAVLKDSNVKYLYETFEPKSPENVAKVVSLCIELLQKYGTKPWNTAIEQISKWLLHCLYL